MAWIPRASERKRVLWKATLLEDDRRLDCTACDISAGGARVRVSGPLPVNSKVVLTIERLGSFPGEIRWQNETHVGIRFLGDAQTFEERLRRAAGASGEATPPARS
jgi:hypothetical protein